MKKNKQKYKLVLELKVVVNDTVMNVPEEELEDFYDECSDYISDIISATTDVNNVDIIFDNSTGAEIAHCTAYYYTTNPEATKESIYDILVELEDYEYHGEIVSISC